MKRLIWKRPFQIHFFCCFKTIKHTSLQLTLEKKLLTAELDRFDKNFLETALSKCKNSKLNIVDFRVLRF
jgi:hypothetical protein